MATTGSLGGRDRVVVGGVLSIEAKATAKQKTYFFIWQMTMIWNTVIQKYNHSGNLMMKTWHSRFPLLLSECMNNSM